MSLGFLGCALCVGGVFGLSDVGVLELCVGGVLGLCVVGVLGG